MLKCTKSSSQLACFFKPSLEQGLQRKSEALAHGNLRTLLTGMFCVCWMLQGEHTNQVHNPSRFKTLLPLPTFLGIACCFALSLPLRMLIMSYLMKSHVLGPGIVP